DIARCAGRAGGGMAGRVRKASRTAAARCLRTDRPSRLRRRRDARRDMGSSELGRRMAASRLRSREEPAVPRLPAQTELHARGVEGSRAGPNALEERLRGIATPRKPRKRESTKNEILGFRVFRDFVCFVPILTLQATSILGRSVSA